MNKGKRLNVSLVAVLLWLGLCAPAQAVSLVGTADLADGAVTTPKLAAGAVTDEKISGTISGSKLGAHGHYGSDLVDASVTGAKLTDGAVTDSKISGPISSSKIDTTGLNADLLDGKHASEFAPAVHIHDPLEKYPNVIIVAKVGGDYMDVSTALNAITDASATNPYLIRIMPGVYAGRDIVLKSYVSIQGSGRNVTTLLSDNTYSLIGADIYGVEIKDLQLEGKSNQANFYTTLLTIYTSGSIRVQNVDFFINGNGGSCISPNGSEVDITVENITCRGYAEANQGYGMAGIIGTGGDVTVRNSIFDLTSNTNTTAVSSCVGRLEITNSRLTARTLSFDQPAIGIFHGGCSGGIALPADRDNGVILTDSRVSGGTSSVRMENSLSIQDGTLSGYLNAASSQFDGPQDFAGSGTYRIVNSYDGAFAPLPNR